jgi:hypothetical protein
MIRSLLLVPSFLALALTSCSSQDRSISEKIKSQVHASSTAPLDLTFVGPNGWERVCIFGPYTTNNLVEADLGFKWNADSESSVSINDGVNLIVFTRGNEVVAFAEHKRGDGDFESEKSRCTSRAAPRLARTMRADGVPLFTVPQ